MLVVLGVIMLLVVALVVVLLLWAAVALMGREPEPVPMPVSMPEPSEELLLPPPETPVEAPPQPLDRGLIGGAFMDSSWDDDDEAATEVAVLPPSAPPPPPPSPGLTPMSLDALEDADEQATEVLDANANAELAAALRAAREEEIPSFGDASFGDRGGAYFDDDWDEEEAPTAVMTGDMADVYAEMLLDDDDDDEPPSGPGRVVAKK